jgi:hypothetical protein
MIAPGANDGPGADAHSDAEPNARRSGPKAALALRLLRPREAGWDLWLTHVRHDVYHTAGFHRYAEASGEGTAYLAVVGDGARGLAWPYLLRRVADVPWLENSDATDVTSVYGYPGPLAWGCEPGDPFIERAWEALVACWRGQGAVTAFTRSHPILGNAALLASVGHATAPDHRLGSVREVGPTVSIDCTLPDEGMRAEYDHGVRRGIVASRELGMVTVHDEAWAHAEDFHRLYLATMIRNNASSYYFFDRDNINRLRAELPGRIHLLVTDWCGEVVAAGIFTEYDGIVQSYLAASDISIRPSPRLVFNDDARRWARARGDTLLHLGGGRGARDDSLLRFKERFSSLRHRFHVGRWVLDWEAYEQLTRQRGACHGAAVSVDPDFFPAYRAPAAEEHQEPDEAPPACPAPFDAAL